MRQEREERVIAVSRLVTAIVTLMLKLLDIKPDKHPMLQNKHIMKP